MKPIECNECERPVRTKLYPRDGATGEECELCHRYGLTFNAIHDIIDDIALLADDLKDVQSVLNSAAKDIGKLSVKVSEIDTRLNAVDGLVLDQLEALYEEIGKEQ